MSRRDQAAGFNVAVDFSAPRRSRRLPPLALAAVALLVLAAASLAVSQLLLH